MGHYDSCYEFDENQRRKEKLQSMKKLGKQAEELRLALKGHQIPDRFKHNLEDLQNWLAVQK